MNRSRMIFLLLVVLAIAAIVGFRWWSGRSVAPAVVVSRLDPTPVRSIPVQAITLPQSVAKEPENVVQSEAPVSEVKTPDSNDRTETVTSSSKPVIQTSTPDLSERRAAISLLATAQDLESAQKLMRFGQESGLHNSAAVEALASFPQAEVTSYLNARLTDPDPRIVMAAAKGLAGRDGSVLALTAAVKANRSRPDGFEHLVCAACVEALGKSRHPDAITALAAELQETVGTSLNLEYGSQVVAALGNTGSASAITALAAYRLRLGSKVERAKADSGVSAYLQQKINEIDTVISRLGKPLP